MPQIVNGVFTIPLMSLVISAIVGYFSSQIQQERRNAITLSKITSLETRVKIIESWMTRTEANRFTSRDGDNLSKTLNDRLRLHESLAAHGTVASRLSAIETRLNALQGTP